MHHGGLAVIRSLGHAGVRVSAVTEDRWTPAAMSRLLDQRLIWPTTGAEDAGTLLGALVEMGARQPARSLLIATDDEAAVLVAEGREALEPYFVLPRVPERLPRTLASKRGLYELCRLHGVGTPPTLFPTTASELADAADELGYPLVLKSVDPFVRLLNRQVVGTTLVRSPVDLVERVTAWEEPFEILAQEYLPSETSQDWILDGYCDSDAELVTAFTGIKVRSSPPFANAAALGLVEANAELVGLTREFCRRIGYRGILDLDWRRDSGSGDGFRLVDFNPRVGAQFRLFEDDAGIDVVRALHLDLSGRPIPAGAPVEGDRLLIEHHAVAARLSGGWSATAKGASLCEGPARRPRAAWLSWDDPLPALALVIRQLAWSLRRLGRDVARRGIHIRQSPRRLR
jgi:predicted ATP-grasp superfamily ATP-dependent carboligase